MLSWALRYLAVAIAVSCGFALLQGSHWLDPAPAARAPTPSMAAEPRRATGGDDAWTHTVDAGPHGHFVLDAVVDGVPVSFLVDTGASAIVLSLDDARALGLEPRSLEFSQRFQTANGVVRGAPVSLRELRIGQFSLYDVEASVNEAPLGISLLGMSFLDRLAGYAVEDGRLLLRW